MNREIKFRVWTGNMMEYNITAGKFGTFYVNPEKGDGLNPQDTASLTTCTTKYPDNIPVMQFTGFRDKNGKEIYEGDILKTEIKKPMTVIWSEEYSSFCIEHTELSFKQVFNKSCNPIRCGIIGNIYQNPELLKNKTK